MFHVQEQIRAILSSSGRLAVPVDRLDENTDLFSAGLDSLAIVNVLLNLEDHFNIELPDEMLSRQSFTSIARIEEIVGGLLARTASTSA